MFHLVTIEDKIENQKKKRKLNSHLSPLPSIPSMEKVN